MQAKIEKLVPGGQGIATLEDGKKAFIWNALPGETVEFEITKDKRSYCEGIATNILVAAPERIAPKDNCYLATSPWQIISYDEELKQKTLIVQESAAPRKNGLYYSTIGQRAQRHATDVAYCRRFARPVTVSVSPQSPVAASTVFTSFGSAK